MARIAEMLTKSRMYKSIIRTVKKAVIAIAKCVRQSKIESYEMPCGVTGTAQHTGLKGNLSAVAKNRSIGTWKVPDVEPLRAKKRWGGNPCRHLPEVRYNFS